MATYIEETQAVPADSRYRRRLLKNGIVVVDWDGNCEAYLLKHMTDEDRYQDDGLKSYNMFQSRSEMAVGWRARDKAFNRS